VNVAEALTGVTSMIPSATRRLVEINLSTRDIAPREVPEEMLRRYLGGSGLAAGGVAPPACSARRAGLYS